MFCSHLFFIRINLSEESVMSCFPVLFFESCSCSSRSPPRVRHLRLVVCPALNSSQLCPLTCFFFPSSTISLVLRCLINSLVSVLFFFVKLHLRGVLKLTVITNHMLRFQSIICIVLWELRCVFIGPTIALNLACALKLLMQPPMFRKAPQVSLKHFHASVRWAYR